MLATIVCINCWPSPPSLESRQSQVPTVSPAPTGISVSTKQRSLGDILQEFSQHRQIMQQELQKVIVGQSEVIEQLFAAIFTRGHCLLEGVPGLAKTLMVSTLARILDTAMMATYVISVGAIMRDVLIALLPACAVGLYWFGLHALWVLILCVGACMAVEAACQKLMSTRITLGDGSAAVTGLLLGMTMPPQAEWWLCSTPPVAAGLSPTPPALRLHSACTPPALRL